MVRRASLAFLLGLLEGACAPDRTLEIKATDEDLVVAAMVDSRGNVLSRGFLTDDTLQLEADPDAQPIAWAIPKNLLLDLDGRPLTETGLERIQLGEGKVGCGRCPLETSDGPLVLSAGMSCGVPSFARLLNDDANVDSLVRGRVRLEWPGPCECRIPGNVAEPVPLELEALTPESWPILAAATNDDSTAFFGEHVAVRISGSSKKLREHPEFQLPGPVLGAVGIGDSYLVATHDPGADPTDSRFVLVDAELQIRQLGAPLRVRPTDIYRDPGGMVVVAGGSGGRSAGLLLCTDPLDEASCRVAFQSGIPSIDADFESITAGPDGGLIIVGTDGGILVLEGVPGELAEIITTANTSTSARGFILGAQGERLRWHFATNGFDPSYATTPIVVNGGSVFACADDRTGATFLTASFSLTGLDWRVLKLVPHTSCWTGRREADGAVFTSLDGSRSTYCDAISCVEEPIEIAAPGIERPARYVEGREGEQLAFVDSSGFRRLQDAPSFEQLYGAAGQKGGLLVRRSGSTVELGDGFISIVSSTGQSERVIRTELEGQTFFSAATDSVDDVVIALSRGPCPDWALWSVSSDLELERRSVPELGCPLWAGVASVGPHRFLIATSEARLFALIDRELQEIPINWDDPATGEFEGKDDLRCTEFRAVSGALGGALAVGCGGLLVRANLYARPPVAFRTVLPVLKVSPPSLEVAQMDCGDLALLAGPGLEPSNFEQGRVWRMHPDGGPATPTGASVAIELVTENDRAFASDQLRSAKQIAILGDSTNPVIVFRDSVHQLGASGRFRLDGHSLGSAVLTEDGIVLMASESGALFRTKLP